MGCISKRQRVGDFLFQLLVFLFVADPTNTIFHMKIVVFSLLLFYNLFFIKAEWAMLRYFALCLTAILVPWLFALLRGENVDSAEFSATVNSVFPLLLLPWIGQYNLLRLSVKPVVAVVCVVLVIYWAIIFYPRLEGIVYLFMCAHDHTIMLSRRAFLGFSMFGMYCKATVAFLPVFALLLYNAFTAERRARSSVFLLLLFVHLFLISGTRSTIVLPVFLALVLFFIFYRNKRYCNYVVYPSAMVAIFAFIVILSLLLLETNEHSNMVKYAHLASYSDLFSENPLYLLIGQGPGTAFYTEGFAKMSFKTEWSYMELWRNFGVFAFFIIYTFLYPLVSLCRVALKNDEALVLAITYIVYLVIAGTNPLLLSSTGMLVLLTMFSASKGYAKKCEIMQRNDCDNVSFS